MFFILLQYGKVKRKLLDEVSRLTNKWLHDSSLKDIAFKTLMVMPNVETYLRLLKVICLWKKAR